MSAQKVFVIGIVAFEDLDNRLFKVVSRTESDAIATAVNMFYKEQPKIYANEDFQNWLKELPEDKEALLDELHQGQLSVGVLQI